jgi:hypothetical protein
MGMLALAGRVPASSMQTLACSPMSPRAMTSTLPEGSSLAILGWRGNALGIWSMLGLVEEAGRMVRVLFTANIQRHVACPELEVDGATLREVLDNAFRENARARAYVLDD